MAVAGGPLVRFPSTSSQLPWYRSFDPVLPLDLPPTTSTIRVPAATPVSSGASRQLTRLIEPLEFNQGVRQLGNKATLLSHATLSIVRQLLDSLWADRPDLVIDQVFVVCDKHGGRARYGGVLQEVFSESWIQVLSERPESSRYRMRWSEASVVFEFLAKGESQLPIAAASMISKFVREVAMLAFNRFWQQQKPGLPPTAGYPVDAKRFRREIEPLIPQLGLEEADWWRGR